MCWNFDREQQHDISCTVKLAYIYTHCMGPESEMTVELQQIIHKMPNMIIGNYFDDFE